MLKRCRKVVAPLHRRIFVWFGGAILSSAAVVFLVSSVLGGNTSTWRRTFEGGRRFVANRFAEVWDDPERRAALAREVSRELDVDVRVRDTSGETLDTAGTRGCTRSDIAFEPTRDGKPLGRVEICAEHLQHKPVPAILAVLAGVMMLWLLSHKVARRLGKPLLDLVQVTDSIGRGDYDVSIETHRHAPTEIVHLNGAVRDMASKIKRQLADQRELLASVSHELRSPLARIRLLLELVRDETLPPEKRAKFIEELEQEVVEIDDLVGGLLAQSRLDFSALSLRPNDLVASTKRAIDRASLDLSPIVSGDARLVDFDATLVARALTNLFDNAKKHGAGVTGVNVRFESDRVCIEVEDRGPGLGDAPDSERIFDPFYGKPRGTQESLGLGLALVRRIARAHQGEAYAENRPSGGALVGFWIRSRP